MVYSGLPWVAFQNYSLYGCHIIAIRAISSRVYPIFRGYTFHRFIPAIICWISIL